MALSILDLQDVTSLCECSEDNDLTVTPAMSLPEGWTWRDWDDGSGSLNGPAKNQRFLFGYDLSPYSSSGGIEYQESTERPYNVFWGTLAEYKEWAEARVQKVL